MAALLAPRRARPRPRSSAPRVDHASTTGRGPRPVPPPRLRRARAGQARRGAVARGPILLVLALLVAAAVGVGAWWFGWARYTTTPAVLGLTQADAEQRLEAAGLEVEVGDAGYSETVDAGQVIEHRPRAPARGSSTAARDRHGLAGQGALRGPEAERHDRGRGPGQDRSRRNLAFGKTTRKFSETVPEGIVIGTDPKAGTTLRPGTIVDLVVSKGRQPIPVGNWVGKDADDAERVLEKRGLEVDVVPRSTPTRSPRATSSPRTRRSGTLFSGDTVKLVVSLGPELVEVPASSPRASTPPPRRSRTPASRSRSRRRRATSASASSSRWTPAPATRSPRARRSPSTSSRPAFRDGCCATSSTTGTRPVIGSRERHATLSPHPAQTSPRATPTSSINAPRRLLRNLLNHPPLPLIGACGILAPVSQPRDRHEPPRLDCSTSSPAFPDCFCATSQPPSPSAGA